MSRLFLSMLTAMIFVASATAWVFHDAQAHEGQDQTPNALSQTSTQTASGSSRCTMGTDVVLHPTTGELITARRAIC